MKLLSFPYFRNCFWAANKEHSLWFPFFGQIQCLLNRFHCKEGPTRPHSTESLGVRGEQELHPRRSDGLHGHPKFGFGASFVGIRVHLAHVEAEENGNRRGGDAVFRSLHLRLNFFRGNVVAFEIALKVICHRVGEFFSDGGIFQYHESPRLAVVRGRGEGRSGENRLDD